MEDYLNKVLETVAFIRERITEKPDIALILGSGLGGLADEVNERIEIPYSEIPHFPSSNVEGHENQLIIGKIYGKSVIMMQGRFHYYEGYEMAEIAFPIKVFSFLGVTKLIVSNAAGGIHPSLKAGDLVLLKDHINLSGLSPLRGEYISAFGERFPNMKNAYSARLIEIAKAQMAIIKEEKNTENKMKTKDRILGNAKKMEKKSEETLLEDLGEFAGVSFEAADIELKEGVYAYMPGPQYETDAEIKMLSMLGADCVGMSTVPEVISAVQSGIEVLGISCITNVCHSVVPPTHQEVLATAERVSDGFKTLVMHIIMAL